MNRLIFSGLAACALMAPAIVRAQDVTGAIRGAVTAENRPVARADVIIEHQPSGTRSRTASDASGTFAATGLRAGGPYIVTIAAPGFESYSVSEIMLAAGQPLRLPIRLAAQQELLVTADTLRATRLSGGPMTVYRQAEIGGIASVRRDIRDIARRDPFVTVDPVAPGGIQIAALNGGLNRVSVDGVRVSGDSGLNRNGLPSARGPVSLDAIGQIAVKIAPYDVTEGDVQGGAIDVVLRSGDNTFSGSVFASQYGDPPGALGNRNQGGFLAGPIVQDRLFFALGYERMDEDGHAATAADLADVTGYDEKYSAKIDWNMADGQRAALSYIHDGAGARAAGDWRAGEILDAGALQINTDWSGRFSTQARLTYRRIAQEIDLADPVTSEAIGGEITANWRIGRHALKAMLGHERLDFDRRAVADARSTVSGTSAAVQDSWDVNDALNLTYGARVDAWRISGERQSVIQPRLSLTWQPKRRFTMRAGFGLFAAAAPDMRMADARLPSVWKTSLSVDYTMDLGPFGDGWRLGGDLVHVAVNSATLPVEGHEGRAVTAVARLGTEFDFGLAAHIAYVRQYAKNHDSDLMVHDVLSQAIRSTIKFALDYAHAFVGDHKTRFSLFGEWRSGRDYSVPLHDAPLPMPGALRIDLHVDQELPVPQAGGVRLTLFADAENLLNLIDRDWGEPDPMVAQISYGGVRVGARIAF